MTRGDTASTASSSCRGRALRRVSLTLIVALICLVSVARATVVDTTKVRDPEPPKKKLGSKILSGTSFVLYSPFLVVEGVTRGLVWAGYDQPYGRRVINFLFDSKRPINPIFGTGGNGGFGGGLSFKLRNLAREGDQFKISGTYSVCNYQSYRLRYRSAEEHQARFRYVFRATYDRMTRERFYGYGSGSDEDNEVTYTHEVLGGTLDLDWSLSRRVQFSLIGGVRAHNIFDGQDDEHPTNLDDIRDRLGLSREDLRASRYWLIGGQARYDWRDLPGRPLKGSVLSVDYTYHKGFDRSEDLRFMRLRGDFRQYVELFDRRTLEFRLLAQSIDIMDKENRPRNPIYLLSELGGEDGLRGYRPSRFADKEFALAALEYRWPVWDVIDGYLFIEEGRVFDSFTDSFTFEDWRWSVGTGLRVWLPQGEIFRIEVAGSIEDIRFYLRFGDVI